MPSTTADKVIGQTLYARQPVELLKRIGDKPYKTLPTGSIIGVVNTWVKRDGALYWYFIEGYNSFYVKHDANKLKLSKTSAQELENKQEEEKLKQRGVIPYYIEKYGLWILGAIAVITLGKEVIKKKL